VAGPILPNTPYRVIRFAMQDAGLLGMGQEPNSEELADYLVRLNELVNFWQTQGLKLWLNEDTTVPLVAGTATYFLATAGVKPLRVIQGYYLDSSDNRREITVLSRDEYTRLSNVTQEGQINSYFVDKQQSTLNVTFWLTPDADAATGTAHLILQQPIDNQIELDETVNFPSEWFIALHWGLAAEIATGQPQSVINRCEAKALQYRTMLEDWDVEDAPTRFTVDSQRMHPGRFT
jgi:hypothetical protein